jgi:putative spermidine/putrescine transport system substrate-binding protein
MTMEQATKAGAVPADLSLYGKGDLLRGRNIGGLFHALDLAKIPNARNLPDIYIFRDDNSGDVLGIGAMAWYTALVVNTHTVQTLPQSWANCGGLRFLVAVVDLR